MSILDDLVKTFDGATSKTRAVRGGSSDRGELSVGLGAERGTSESSIVAAWVVDMTTYLMLRCAENNVVRCEKIRRKN